jgi:serine/threonine protein kinase
MASDELTAAFSFREGGTTRWMSPELFVPEKFGLQECRPTKEADCYALGMVIYEVLSGQKPFAPSKGPVLRRKIVDGERPSRPRGKEGEVFTDEIWGALELCWKPRPRDRISASAVLLRLEGHPPLVRPSFGVGGGVKPGSDNQLDTATKDSSTFPHFILG